MTKVLTPWLIRWRAVTSAFTPRLWLPANTATVGANGRSDVAAVPAASGRRLH